MVPYADLINHSPFSQAYIDAREGGDWLFSSGEEEVILYADRGYRRMEQVRSGVGLFDTLSKVSIRIGALTRVRFFVLNLHIISRYIYPTDKNQMLNCYCCMDSP